jgi:Uma2 family endonuclease
LLKDLQLSVEFHCMCIRAADAIFCQDCLFEDHDMRTETTKKRFTVHEYYRMAEIGILTDNVRTELINGEIIEMSPMGARHAAVVSRLNDLLVPLLKGKALLRPQLPLRLNDYNEPQPDLCFVKSRRDYYSEKHPGSGDTLLAVEVSDSSLSYGRDVKCGVYAASRVLEYWLVDVAGGVLMVFREPSKGAYQTSLTFRAGDKVAPLAFADVSIRVADLLGVSAE